MSQTASTLHLLIAIVLWYGFNTGANVYSKKFLNAKHDPMFLSFVSMVFGSILLAGWKLVDVLTGRSATKPIYFVRTIPVAIFHLGNTLLTYISMTSSSVALTYTIKAAEPLFTATGNYLIKRQVESLPVYASLVVVLIGVALTSVTDATFNTLGLVAALASNVTSTLRSIFVKADMETHPVAKSPSQFFAQISLVATVLSVPLVLLRWMSVDANSLVVDAIPVGGSLTDVPIVTVVLAGLLNAAYNLSSYHVIAHVHVLTHAVALVMKRVVLIIASLVIFGQAVSPLLVVGVLLSNLGVMCYAYFKSKSHAPTKHAPGSHSNSGVSSTVWRCSIFIAIITLVVFAAGEAKTAQITDINYESTYKAPLGTREDIIKRELQRNECLQQVKITSYERYKDVVREKQHVTLVDVPLHGSLSDGATWYAEQVLFYSYGQYLVNLDKEANTFLRKLQDMPFGTVFFTGIVPFGDANRAPIDYQFELMDKYPDIRIVYFPTSISYDSPALLKRDQQALDAREDVYMFLRDSQSLAMARKHFPKVQSEYLPDIVWTFGRQERAQKPVVDVLIAIDSAESTMGLQLDAAKKVLDKKGVTYEVWDMANPNMKIIAPFLDISPPEHRDLWPSFRAQLFNKLISRGKVLITDHLQASSYGSLLRIPVVYLDDKQKTISKTRSDLKNFFATCDNYALDIYAAKNGANAAARAIDLVARVESEELFWA
jgi:solute carrier family 35 protein E1